MEPFWSHCRRRVNGSQDLNIASRTLAQRGA
jgi:hypothetical protein